MGKTVKKCPNCGGMPKLHRKRNRFKYECDGDCWTATDWCSSPEEAAEEWNSIQPKPEPNELYEVLLTGEEIENLIAGCTAQISEFCICSDEKEPFFDLIQKLESVVNNGS